MPEPRLPGSADESHDKSRLQTTIKQKGEHEVHVQQSVDAAHGGNANKILQEVEVNIFNQTYSINYRWHIAAVAAILLAICGSTVWAVAQSNSVKQDKMTAILRVAVAGFQVNGSNQNMELGNDIAQELAINIDRALNDLNLGFSHQVWGPDRIGQIQGSTREERALSAERIAEEYNAFIVVYGVIDTSTSSWWVTPEFLLTGLSFADALEVTGQHELGSPFPVAGYGDDASRLALSSLLASRVEPFAQLAIGIAFYKAGEFERAYEELVTIENESIWPDDIGGRQLLYLLLGNIAGRKDQLDQAEAWYRQALLEQPGYARAFVGLGNVYFVRALNSIPSDAEDFRDLDLSLIQQSIDYYQQAESARIQPEQSDISTKVHFGLGQAYLMQSYANEAVMVAPAIPEFEAVIEAYANGENPRVMELAAEAYIRLGTIYIAGGDKEYGAELYEKGINLFKQMGNLERSAFLESQLEGLMN
ncbi:MAG: hypothetical protein KDE34_00020 [Anaerolineales bacterium]|nr:hypothetical protein [Anaerolineales bacterium]